MGDKKQEDCNYAITQRLLGLVSRLNIGLASTIVEEKIELGDLSGKIKYGTRLFKDGKRVREQA